MKNKWRILKILTTLVIFGFLLSFSLKRFNNASMEKVVVHLITPKGTTPVYFIDEKDVKEFVRKENPSNRIGDIDIPNLEKEVNAFPSVDSSNVYITLNGVLNVDIIQRIPAFRLNTNGQDFYVDTKAEEFPVSKNYTHPVLLVTGDVKKGEYKKVVELVEKINRDDFSKNYFIGISKEGKNYFLHTAEGNYKVEIGDLEHIDFKIKGFKEFAEKFLVGQSPEKYTKVSVKYDNQIVTTLNPNFKENDSIIGIGNKEIAKSPEAIEKEVKEKKAEKKVASGTAEKPKSAVKNTNKKK